jgi:hypothetical protein
MDIKYCVNLLGLQTKINLMTLPLDNSRCALAQVREADPSAVDLPTGHDAGHGLICGVQGL